MSAGSFIYLSIVKTPADVSPRQLKLVILISSDLVGWVIAMLTAPLSPEEPAIFSQSARSISTFVTGYLVAKIDRIFDVAMKQDENVNGRFVGRLLLFVSVFATRCASTFVW